MTLLACRVATKVYGSGHRSRRAIDRCSLSAVAGEVIGIVGPNGAGKTTLLRLIAGELPLTEGSISVAGHRAATRLARRGVGYAPDPPLAPPELSGGEWLHYLASQRARSAGERLGMVRWAMDVGEITDFADRRVATYSRGMAQRLALSAAVLQGPVLVLDEILSGVDPLVQRRLRGQVIRLANEGRLVLIASHDLGALERVTTRVLVLWDGRVAADVATSALVGERVAELTLAGAATSACDRLLRRFRGSRRTGIGVSVPLSRGLSLEQVLADCRELRVAVAGSRIRFRALEDLLVEAADRNVDLG